MAGPFMGKPALSGGGRGFLSGARVLMMIMCVIMEELLCQGVMGWIPVLECPFARCAWVPVVTSYHA
jgi:hypothetical protein